MVAPKISWDCGSKPKNHIVAPCIGHTMMVVEQQVLGLGWYSLERPRGLEGPEASKSLEISKGFHWHMMRLHCRSLAEGLRKSSFLEE